jgi:hypothetical protein
MRIVILETLYALLKLLLESSAIIGAPGSKAKCIVL